MGLEEVRGLEELIKKKKKKRIRGKTAKENENENERGGKRGNKT